ncbi:MAG: lysophospholipid acyltransferase family protein [Pseudomonadota bacterium]
MTAVREGEAPKIPPAAPETVAPARTEIEGDARPPTAQTGTWRGAEPPTLPPLTKSQKLRGYTRLAAFIVMTLIALALFVSGRYLRHWLGHAISYHFWVARLWSRGGLWLAGLRHRVEGRPVKGGALVANHCSWLDIFTLRACALMYFVSKAEVADWPGVGFVTKVAGTIFIERRRSQAKAQEAVLRSRIAADQLLMFFPEGTSTDGMQVLPFKSSLFSAFYEEGEGADLLIQPVSLRYHPDPASDLPDSFYAWWGDMPFYAHILDVFARSRRGEARVIFHEPLRPAEIGDRKALAQHAGRAVAEGHARL